MAAGIFRLQPDRVPRLGNGLVVPAFRAQQARELVARLDGAAVEGDRLAQYRDALGRAPSPRRDHAEQQHRWKEAGHHR